MLLPAILILTLSNPSVIEFHLVQFVDEGVDVYSTQLVIVALGTGAPGGWLEGITISIGELKSNTI